MTLYAVVASTTTSITVSNHELGIQGHLSIEHSYQVHELVLLYSQFDRHLKNNQLAGGGDFKLFFNNVLPESTVSPSLPGTEVIKS